MITVTVSQFKELRDLAKEASTFKNPDGKYQDGVNRFGNHLLRKLNQISEPEKICKLCDKEANAKNQ